VHQAQLYSSADSAESYFFHAAGTYNYPRFLGRYFSQDGDLDICWYCVGMIKTALAFFPNTAEKHTSPAPARTADHCIRPYCKFKADILDPALTFLKPVHFPICFAAVVDFADLQPDSEHSGDSEPFNACELDSIHCMNKVLTKCFVLI
jgi:hypothetical protein